MIINLMATPRNLSTALMYSFRSRSDCKVIDEPFFGHFLAHSDAFRPSRDETLAQWPSKMSDIQEWITSSSQETEHLFIKNMASHHLEVDSSYAIDYTNIFVLRHPGLIINSFSRGVVTPNMADIGLKLQHQIYDELISHGARCIVIDSEELLQNPASYLASLCKQIGLLWESQMLIWPKGPKPEDGPWAKYWYTNLHSSSGFQKYVEKPKDVKPELEELLAECMIHYRYLSSYKMTL